MNTIENKMKLTKRIFILFIFFLLTLIYYVAFADEGSDDIGLYYCAIETKKVESEGLSSMIDICAHEKKLPNKDWKMYLGRVEKGLKHIVYIKGPWSEVDKYKKKKWSNTKGSPFPCQTIGNEIYGYFAPADKVKINERILTSKEKFQLEDKIQLYGAELTQPRTLNYKLNEYTCQLGNDFSFKIKLIP